MTKPLLVIVTGANRGIGLAICKNILSKPNLAPVKLFATSRKGEDLGLSNGESGGREVLYPKLDISNAESIKSFRDEIVKQHGEVGVLINNAGVNLDEKYSVETVKQTLDVNYRGTVKMCQAFIPHLTPTARIVNMASIASTLKLYSPAIQTRLLNAPSLERLDELATEFETAVKAQNEVGAGFSAPGRAYSFSKALLRAATTILSRQVRDANPESKVLINCCCPGWVKTDMGRIVGKPPKTEEEGAVIPVRLGFEEIEGVTGHYWANDSVRSREAGKVQRWEDTRS